MKIKFPKVLVAVIVLVLTSLACSMPGSSSALLEDDFSDPTWGTGTDADSSVQYENGALHFFVNKPLYFVWSTPNDTTYENIHIEVTATNDSADSTGAFGIICNMQITDTSYYFAVTGAGEYAIGRYTLTSDDLLTNGGEWATSDVIPSEADSYRIGADCGNNTLTLYVNGQPVDSVTDSTYTSGMLGLYAWSGDQQNGTDVSFDDFIVTKLGQ